MTVWTSLLGGALLLLWPAIYNGWLLVFTDTGAFMFAALERWPQWDKPIAYALFLHALSWRWTYHIAGFAQALIVSHLVWLCLRVFAAVTPWRHLALMAALAGLTAIPWFTSQLMPDFLAPVLVLAVVLLGVGDASVARPDPHPDPLPQRGRGGAGGNVGTPSPALRERAGVRALSAAERLWLAFLIALAAASHLSHLGVLLGLLVCVVPVRKLCGLAAWPRAGGIPLGAAAAASIAFLVASNAVMWGKPVVSPYGSVFPLARQLANGPAVAWLRANCPGYVLCDHLDRVGTDSDRILWDADSALWAGGDETVMAPEASKILAGTIRTFPGEVAANALRDSAHQLVKVRIGDSLIPDGLDTKVLNNLQKHLPHEVARFTAARQINDRLDIVPAMNLLILGTMMLSVLALPWLLWRAHDRKLTAAVLLVLLALLGNAVICGATSKPHHRYQARVAWLLPLMAGVAVAAIRRPPALARTAPAPA
jgi:hypothetical protein